MIAPTITVFTIVNRAPLNDEKIVYTRDEADTINATINPLIMPFILKSQEDINNPITNHVIPVDIYIIVSSLG